MPHDFFHVFNWVLILQYLQALCWPAIALVALTVFRRPIASKIGDVKSASVVGLDVDFDTQAKALKLKAEGLVDEEQEAHKELPASETETQPNDTPPSSGASEAQHQPACDHNTGEDNQPQGEASEPQTSPADAAAPDWTRTLTPRAAQRLDRSFIDLMTDPDFDEARRIVAISTPAAILTAHREMERCLRAAWTIDSPSNKRHIASTSNMVRDLGLDHDFGEVIDDLRTLRNNYAHGSAADRVSEPSALSYIDACEAVAQAARSKVMSKLRHPSGAHPFLRYLNGNRPS